MSLNKKIVILILVLSLILNGVFLLPSKVKATIGLNVTCMSGAGMVIGAGYSPCYSEAAAIAIETKRTAKETIVFTWEKFQKYLETQLWPALRDMIAKRLMDYIVNQTVKWIQGGGKPKFIGNWEGFVKDVGDIAFDSAIREVGLAKLCTPFGLNIMIGLLPVEDFGQRIDCTLDKVVSNIQNFYVDFSVGGWRGYNLLWQPENNYYGVAINIADEIMTRTSKKADAAKSEGLAGAGFMGDKVCKAGSGEDEAVVAEAMRSDGGRACSAKLDSCIDAFSKDKEYIAGCREEYSMCIDDEKGGAAKSRGFLADRSGEYCDPKNMVDATPGSMIGKAVGESITSDSKWAASIQSWVSALVNAVINRVIKEGVGMMQESLGGDKKDSYYPAEYGSMLGQEWEKDKQQMYGEINKFTSEWQYLLDAKNQSLSRASSTLAVLQQLQQIQLTASSTLPSACEPLVTAQDIQTVQNDIDRLTIEIQAPQAKISAADSAKAAINVKLQDLGGVKQVAPDEFQRAAAQTAYQDFINQYGTTAQIEAILSGSDREAADTEKQAKQTELDNIQIRLNACQAAINSPPAP